LINLIRGITPNLYSLMTDSYKVFLVGLLGFYFIVVTQSEQMIQARFYEPDCKGEPYDVLVMDANICRHTQYMTYELWTCSEGCAVLSQCQDSACSVGCQVIVNVTSPTCWTPQLYNQSTLLECTPAYKPPSDVPIYTSTLFQNSSCKGEVIQEEFLICNICLQYNLAPTFVRYTCDANWLYAHYCDDDLCTKNCLIEKYSPITSCSSYSETVYYTSTCTLPSSI